jgi:serine phosphatase RsbU (regulator of sigma subunit)
MFKLLWSCFFWLFVVAVSPSLSQTVSIIYDGFTGLEHFKMMDDTVFVSDVDSRSPAGEAGIKNDDIILSINAIPVSGQLLSISDVKKLLYRREGSVVELVVQKPGGGSPVEYELAPISAGSFWRNIDFDYLVDSSGQWTIHDILRDSIRERFINPVQNKILIRSVMPDSRAEEAGLCAGDRIISLSGAVSQPAVPWLTIETGYLKPFTRDTSIVVLRDSLELPLALNPMQAKDWKGVTSQYAEDLEQQVMWIRIQSENRITADRTYLFRVQSDTWSMHLYEVVHDTVISEAGSGMDLAWEDRDYIHKTWEVIRLRLRENWQQTFYVRLSAHESVSDAIPEVIPLETVTRFDRVERSIFFLLAGMMLLICFYYLALYFSTWYRSYLYYALFILSYTIRMIGQQGYLGELRGDVPHWAYFNLMEVINALPFLFLMMFGLSYLSIPSRLKFWNRLTWINILFLAALSIYLAILYQISEQIYRSGFTDVLFDAYYISMYLVTFGTLLTTSILRIRQGFKPAWYFLVANVFFAGLLLYNEFTWGAFTEKVSSASNVKIILQNSGMLLGAIIQFLVLSAGLGQKMKAFEIARKKAQEKLIAQLRENELLKDKVNRELEQKVSERTQEISEQKEEIQAQRDEIQLQRDMVTTQKQELTDSINYAQRIQAAVLPHKEYLDEVMPEYFVLFKPRDIVSGDFYWVREVKHYLVVAVADCTGHGVPGAFMSMLGITLLNEQVGKSRFDRPGEILNRLRKKVKETLAQEGLDEEQKDGMDMALAIIDRDNLEMQYAGAFNPLFLIRNRLVDGKEFEGLPSLENDDYRLIEFKADRQPIAIHSIETDFTTRVIPLKKGDTLYLFSDGFADQIGGPRAKKFLSRNFKRYLLEIQAGTMEQQHKQLDDTLEQWREGYEQVDDILVMGIRI